MMTVYSGSNDKQDRQEQIVTIDSLIVIGSNRRSRYDDRDIAIVVKGLEIKTYLG